MNHFDPEKLNMPAYLRKKTLVRQSKQKLILTALDRKEAHLPHTSTRALAPSREAGRTPTKFSQKTQRSKHANSLINRTSPENKIRSATPHSSLFQPSTFLQSTFQSSVSQPCQRFPSPRKSRNFIQNEFFAQPLTSAQMNPPDDFAPPTEFPEPVSSVQNSPQLPSSLQAIGTVTHYLPKIDVAIIKLTASLMIGDHVYLPTEDGLLLQQIEEMQIDRQPILRAKVGDHIGLKVVGKVEVEGKVYII